jgi:hypothetical protein
VAQVAEHLLSKHKVLALYSSTANKSKTQKVMKNFN